MSDTTRLVDGSRCARLLSDVANELAAAGATADTVFDDHLADLPIRLAEELRATVRAPEGDEGWLLVRGLLEHFEDPGPTPPHWSKADAVRTAALDIAVMLVSASAGSVFGWRGQQDGRLLHNILPAKGSENMQVGGSSSTPLYWHTEDAFHPDRAGLLVLACVRNPDGLGSRVASIRQARLTERQTELLRQPRLAIVPDDSYPEEWQDSLDDDLRAMSTLWPRQDGLCVRYDPSYTKMLTDDEEFHAAYRALEAALAECSETLPIQAGDIALIDNDVAVHGRAAFTPRFDGTDRWLKRVLVRLPRSRPEEERVEGGYAQQFVFPRYQGAGR